MPKQGSYPMGVRTLANGDTLTGVVTSDTADVPVETLRAFNETTGNLNPANVSAPDLLDGTETWSIRKAGTWARASLSAIASFCAGVALVWQAAGTGAVLRTLVKKFGDYPVTPQDYGAAGNGTTPDDTAIATFWTAVKLVGKGWIPKATYKCNNPIVWDMTGLGDTGVVVEGGGQKAAIFDLSTVTSAPAFLITKTDGAAFYSEFRNFGIRANVAGAALQLGRTDFSDPQNAFSFENMWVGNNNPSTSAIGVQVNYVLGSQFKNIVPACNHGGDSWQINAASFCKWEGGSGTWAQNGIHLTAGGAGTGTIAGNVFEAMDFEENTAASVTIDTNNAHNNTFIGSTFVYNPNSYTPWATSTVYALNAVVISNRAVYKATTGGTSASSGSGPSGTGASISDGTVVWAYQNAGTSVGVNASAGSENFFISPNTLCYPSGTPSYSNFFSNSAGCGLMGKFGMTVGMEIGSPSFYATLSASQNVTAGTWTKGQYDTVGAQRGIGAYDATTKYRFTAPFAGWYRFKHCAIINATNASNAVAYAALYKNGSNLRAAGVSVAAGVNFVAAQVDAMLYLNGGDYIEAWSSIPASSGTPAINGGASNSWFEGQYIG
ncbi:pectin lyase activity [Burkholderia phage BcepB1A]|uniref:pectin lyase activity n=1 Tax=Burkholderia phage BcepB1A TaxID=279530 RepID=UPI00003779BD|nr:pectin lyase activity [Burkholderia phage BcepB1A]AAT37770.1 gp06 [Burkholderia phage BcepB1A]